MLALSFSRVSLGMNSGCQAWPALQRPENQRRHTQLQDWAGSTPYQPNKEVEAREERDVTSALMCGCAL